MQGLKFSLATIVLVPRRVLNRFPCPVHDPSECTHIYEGCHRKSSTFTNLAGATDQGRLARLTTPECPHFPKSVISKVLVISMCPPKVE